MTDQKGSLDKLLESLQERAKELNCIYRVEEVLNQPDTDIDSACKGIIEAVPPGWQYPEMSQARIVIEDKEFKTPGWVESEWVLSADIRLQDKVVGMVEVAYTKSMPQADDGPFLKEEKKLIATIADRLGHFVLHHQMRNVYQEWRTARDGDHSERGGNEWRAVIDLLQQTDQKLFSSLTHKMLNHLCWAGVREAEKLLESRGDVDRSHEDEVIEDSNRPYQQRRFNRAVDLSSEVFHIAERNLSAEDILSRIQKWVREEKLGFLAHVVNRNLSLSDIADALRRFHYAGARDADNESPSMKGIRVSLIRRFLSDQLDYINIAKNYVVVDDFYELSQRLIYSTESHGKLGGKSAGMFLASQIIKKHFEAGEDLATVKIPRTWFMSSDLLLNFMHHNNLVEIVEQKYKPINEVRFEYPHILYTFKNSQFPSEIMKALSVVLDDMGDKPLIVRSSSLLEDRMGAAFSGKYKSVFIANQGSKQKRLESLMDAITEVYASTFGPDPIEYREERGLIDFGEEMGIMVQEVVGTRVGDYFFPSFAGVAFSRNEFRWSPRINREDGLARLVPGLGTRAVDRLSDDYPVMFAPGQPGLRVNASVDDILRYSPRYMDVINLKTNSFETVAVADLLKEFGHQYPLINKIVSIHQDGHISKPLGTHIDFDAADVIANFDGLLSGTKFVRQMRTMLEVLEEQMHTPVDIEFAHDGQHLYLLQCRPQSSSDAGKPAPIPQRVPPEKTVFTANRYVSNGRVPDVTHIVYVDPEKYNNLTDRADLVEVGRIVGKLNKILPKRQFILMGPGRWGSRGDIKLGVRVLYSDINNTAVLIEIARKTGNYTPDLSFGTHFFQDLVEAQIRYLPLYPDDEGIVFNEHFLTRADNILAEVLPKYERFADVIRLIDVPKSAKGKVLRVLMNAELDQAVGMLDSPTGESAAREKLTKPLVETQTDEQNWRWRYHMAESLAGQLEADKFGVKGLYLFGSTKNATAASASDIDLIVHFEGTEEQKAMLDKWFEGWSQALDTINYINTGYKTGGLLDVHYVTDEDIAKKSSYAAKIDAITDPAKKLGIKMGGDGSK